MGRGYMNRMNQGQGRNQRGGGNQQYAQMQQANAGLINQQVLNNAAAIPFNEMLQPPPPGALPLNQMLMT